MSARVALVVLAGCASAAGGPDDTDTADVCGPAGAVRTLATGFDRVSAGGSFGTEGVTFSEDGALYVTARATVERVAQDGGVADVAALPGTIGLAWWRGAVWAGTSDGSARALVAFAADGTQTRYPLDTDVSLNFLTPTPWGTLLVSDPGSDGLWEWAFGAASLTAWKPDVVSPNGAAFSPDGATLYVAHTFRDAHLSAIAVEDRAAGAETRLVDYPLGSAPDGIALAEDGTVVVALNTANRLDAWRDGEAWTLADPVPFAASVAFGRGGWDPCALVATSLFSGDVFEIDAGVRGFFPPWESPP